MLMAVIKGFKISHTEQIVKTTQRANFFVFFNSKAIIIDLSWTGI